MNSGYIQSCSLLLVAAILAGCASAQRSPKQAFFRRHPELREHYAEFYETSPEAIAASDDRVHQAQYVMLNAIRKGYAKYPDLMQSTDAVQTDVDLSVAGCERFVQQIRSDFDPKKDALSISITGKGRNMKQVISF